MLYVCLLYVVVEQAGRQSPIGCTDDEEDKEDKEDGKYFSSGEDDSEDGHLSVDTNPGASPSRQQGSSCSSPTGNKIPLFHSEAERRKEPEERLTDSSAKKVEGGLENDRVDRDRPWGVPTGNGQRKPMVGWKRGRKKNGKFQANKTEELVAEERKEPIDTGARLQEEERGVKVDKPSRNEEQETKVRWLIPERKKGEGASPKRTDRLSKSCYTTTANPRHNVSGSSGKTGTNLNTPPLPRDHHKHPPSKPPPNPKPATLMRVSGQELSGGTAETKQSFSKTARHQDTGASKASMKESSSFSKSQPPLLVKDLPTLPVIATGGKKSESLNKKSDIVFVPSKTHLRAETAPHKEEDSNGPSVQQRLAAKLRQSVKENDYYRLFGVEPSASDEELARVRRQKSAQLHPDHFADRSAIDRLKCVYTCTYYIILHSH